GVQTCALPISAGSRVDWQDLQPAKPSGKSSEDLLQRCWAGNNANTAPRLDDRRSGAQPLFEHALRHDMCFRFEWVRGRAIFRLIERRIHNGKIETAIDQTSIIARLAIQINSASQNPNRARKATINRIA